MLPDFANCHFSISCHGELLVCKQMFWSVSRCSGLSTLHQNKMLHESVQVTRYVNVSSTLTAQQNHLEQLFKNSHAKALPQNDGKTEHFIVKWLGLFYVWVQLRTTFKIYYSYGEHATKTDFYQWVFKQLQRIRNIFWEHGPSETFRTHRAHNYKWYIYCSASHREKKNVFLQVRLKTFLCLLLRMISLW